MDLFWIIYLIPVLLFWLWWRQSRMQIPGPTGWPLVGCLFQIDPERSHNTLSEWALKYGPVYVLTMFRNPMIIVSSYEGIREVLLHQAEAFSGRPVGYRMYVLNKRRDIMTSSPRSPHWSVLRKLAHRYVKLYSSGTELFENKISNVIHYRMQKIAEYDSRAFDIREELFTFTLSTLFILVFGEEVDDNNDEFNMFRDVVNKVGSVLAPTGKGLLLDQFPWLRFFPNETYKALLERKQRVTEFWKRKRDKFISSSNEDQVDCVIKALFEMTKSVSNETQKPIIDEEMIKSVMMNLVGAGILTTTASLYAFINILLNYPEVQRKLRVEVETEIGNERYVKVADREQMPYTRAVILELLRYTSVVPLGIPHLTLQNTHIGGYSVPEGTGVITNLWYLHHDDKIWGDPWTFRPERFLDETGNLVPVDHYNRKHLLAFGAGTRVCIGEVFALNRMFLFIVNLMQKFTVLPEDPNNLPSCDPRTYVSGIVLCPQNYNVRFVQEEH